MRSRRAELAIAIGAIALALLPLVVAVATRIGSDWLPTHDVAVTDMRVRDVWSTDVPLVGPYSRYLWSHPGPVMFWMMAVPSALSGQAAWGTVVAGVVVQAVAIVWAGVVGWRIGRAPVVVLAMIVSLLSVHAVGSIAILEPWNPHVALPWFVLFVLYTWRLGLGHVRSLPGALFVSSFLVQTHVGYLPLVAAGLATAAVLVALDWRHGRMERLPMRTIVLCVLVVAVLWSPVVVEEVTSSPGNLSLLFDHFSGNDVDAEATAGGRAALGLLGSAFVPPPFWLGGTEPHDDLTNVLLPRSAALVAVPIVLLGLGLAGSWKARNRAHLRYAVVVTAVFGSAIVALSRVTGDLLEYLFYWRAPLSAMVVIAAGVGVVDLVVSSTSRDETGGVRAPAGAPASALALAAGLVGLAVLAVTTTHGVATHGRYVRPFEQEVAAVVDQIDLADVRDPVIVRFEGSTLGGLQGGVVAALDRAGAPARVDEALAFQFGDHRAAPSRRVNEIWYVSEDGTLTSLRVSDPRGRVVARTTPLGPADEAEAVRLQTTLWQQIRAADRLDLTPVLDSDLVAIALADVPGVDQAAASRLAELNAVVQASDRCRCSIVAFAPGDVPVPAG